MTSRRHFIAAPGLAAAAPRAADAASLPPQAFEMRHYRTRPGRRDELIAMFEAHFLDAYERAGALILATCRNLDDPDRWWWIRAFPHPAGRRDALAGFYGGAVWRARADACNATLADVGDARLLRALHGAVLQPLPPRPASAHASAPRTVIEARIVEADAAQLQGLAEFEAQQARPLLQSLGAQPLAALATWDELPQEARRTLRDGHAVVTLARFDSVRQHREHVRERAASPAWRAVEEEVARRARGPVEVLRLQPTARSGLR